MFTLRKYHLQFGIEIRVQNDTISKIEGAIIQRVV